MFYCVVFFVVVLELINMFQQSDTRGDINIRVVIKYANTHALQKEIYSSITNRKVEKADGGEPWQNRDHCGEVGQIHAAVNPEPEVGRM